MSLIESIEKKEKALMSKLEEKQSGIDDATGKGSATEIEIENELIIPFLPRWAACGKGAVVTSEKPNEQSGAIDRIISDTAAAPPLIYDESHSIFPIESVAGLIEITMHLNRTKLKGDIERMAPIKAMQTGQYMVDTPNSSTKVTFEKMQRLSPRSFVIGLPEDSNWKPKTIAIALKIIQQELGKPTHVHGLYVLGIGFFRTNPIENDSEEPYRIQAFTGSDRLFRFTNELRISFDRWPDLPFGRTADLDKYIGTSSTKYFEI